MNNGIVEMMNNDDNANNDERDEGDENDCNYGHDEHAGK